MWGVNEKQLIPKFLALWRCVINVDRKMAMTLWCTDNVYIEILVSDFFLTCIWNFPLLIVSISVYVSNSLLFPVYLTVEHATPDVCDISLGGCCLLCDNTNSQCYPLWLLPLGLWLANLYDQLDLSPAHYPFRPGYCNYPHQDWSVWSLLGQTLLWYPNGQLRDAVVLSSQLATPQHCVNCSFHGHSVIFFHCSSFFRLWQP